MSQPPTLTDTTALSRNRARARRASLFLQAAAADDLQDRLDMVKKDFTAPAIVTAFPEVWAGRLPGALLVAEADTLDLAPQAHDAVVHSMGLHWANDPVGQLIQCRRALKPDGLLLVALLAGKTLSELRACLAQAESVVTGGLSPRIAPMADLRDLGALLQRAGLALPVADSVPLTVSYRDAWHLMHDLRAMGEANALDARLRRPTRRAVLDTAARLYSEHFAAPDGRITATFEIVVMTGWAPHSSQPKPLRPGSATARLADALDTSEHPLRD